VSGLVQIRVAVYEFVCVSCVRIACVWVYGCPLHESVLRACYVFVLVRVGVPLGDVVLVRVGVLG
jgi:hypothetical protein